MCENIVQGISEFNIDELPEIDQYRKYAKRLSWYKGIYEKERLIVEEIEQKRIQEYEIYHKNLEEINRKTKE